MIYDHVAGLSSHRGASMRLLDVGNGEEKRREQVGIECACLVGLGFEIKQRHTPFVISNLIWRIL